MRILTPRTPLCLFHVFPRAPDICLVFFFPPTLLAEDILEDWVCELGVDGVLLELDIPLKFAVIVTSYWTCILLAPSSFAPLEHLLPSKKAGLITRVKLTTRLARQSLPLTVQPRLGCQNQRC